MLSRETIVSVVPAIMAAVRVLLFFHYNLFILSVDIANHSCFDLLLLSSSPTAYTPLSSLHCPPSSSTSWAIRSSRQSHRKVSLYTQDHSHAERRLNEWPHSAEFPMLDNLSE